MVVDGRNHLVDWLNGDRRSPIVRRNEKDDRHLKLLLRFGLRATSDCLDVGANRGHFLKVMAQVAPGGHHIAIEPVPHLVEQLRAEYPGVEVRPVALSDRPETYIEFLDKGFISLSGLAEHLNPETLSLSRYTETKITTQRFDSHVPNGWLPDVVKIDVEGAELQVLEGAIATLRMAKPLVAFEHGRLHDNSNELFTLLCEDVGLRMFNMDGEGPLDRHAFIDQLATRWNWVAHE